MRFWRRSVETRALRPVVASNGNDPADCPPGTVGDDAYSPGDPNGIEFAGDWGPGSGSFTRIVPSPWSGWPAEWMSPLWGNGRLQGLVDTAWAALDLNSAVLSTMPVYGLRHEQVVPLPGWASNPDPDRYESWEEFAKQLFWDYQMGEAFILATARYSTGYPARFHVLAPWLVNVEFVDGRRRYSVGALDVTDDILHIRYKSTTEDARGHGPFEAGASRLVAAGVLARYATEFAAGGGVPYYVLTHPDELSASQTQTLLNQWWESRLARNGQPAVLSGGVGITPLSTSPRDAALLELAQFNESRISVLAGVPPFLLGLPSGGDSMTYSNVESLFEYHWRAGLSPKAGAVMPPLSNWLLPAATTVELQRDAYVQPGPYERAQTWAILAGIGVLTADQIARIERFHVDAAGADILAEGVL